MFKKVKIDEAPKAEVNLRFPLYSHFISFVCAELTALHIRAARAGR